MEKVGRIVLVIFLCFLVICSVCYYCMRKRLSLLFSYLAWKADSPPLEISFHEDLLSVEEAKQIIHHARPLLKRSTVVSKENPYNQIRTSRNAMIPVRTFASTERIAKYVSKLTGLPVNNFEEIQVVHYKPQQYYMYHWDSCPPYDNMHCSDTLQISQFGIRRYTYFIYLNNCKKGGETAFEQYDTIRGKPKVGNGILWRNTYMNKTGKEITNFNSKHAGLPVEEGEKWGMNFWVRSKTFVPAALPLW